MGLGDKFKDLKKQAQDAVVEHRDQIQDAVGVVGVAADRKTKGRYTQRIAKFGQKASEAVEKVAEEQPGRGARARWNHRARRTRRSRPHPRPTRRHLTS